jgi:hypothetical protein
VLQALSFDPGARQQTAARLGAELTRELHRLEPAFMPQELASYVAKTCGEPAFPQAQEPGSDPWSTSRLNTVESDWYVTDVATNPCWAGGDQT